MTATWATNIYDRAVSSYVGDTNLATINGLDHIVSFGEDNLGNLYLVDLGYGTTFDGQYTANAGRNFRAGRAARFRRRSTGPTLGTGVKFSWTGSFKLQSQTNSADPGAGANWFDYPGGTNSPVTVPFDAAQSSVLFRLVWPQ